MPKKKKVIQEKKQELRSIDKEDVDISKLFEFKRELELIQANKSTMKVYIRIPNDAEISRARIQAIRLSSELREHLKDKNWSDRELYIPDVSGLSKEELVNLITAYSARELGAEVIDAISLPHPKELAGDASLEEQEEYRRGVDEYPALFEKRMKEDIAKRIASLKEFLGGKSKEELIKVHEEELIKEHCNVRFFDKYRELCVFYGSYKDESYKTVLFDKFETFVDSPGLLKEQLIEGYVRLELTAQALKKSLGATL